MSFTSEQQFEEALVTMLYSSCGWEKEVLINKSEAELLQNWADILFENNRSIDRLNDYPLTKEEMAQILGQIEQLRTPVALNSFINGKTVSLTRDNADDQAHKGKEISLKMYDRQEIAAGQSRYQIVRQPIFNTKNPLISNRRGDLLLLINGMPLIHIELKKSGVPISEACNQIEKYASEGVFTGLFSLVQVFVVMTPEETLYFANPGPDGTFNRDFFFHWGDFNNEPQNQWQDIAHSLLSIPMAHQLIGFYTVADNADGVLKVMRSYQYYAANKISDTVAKNHWEERHQLGGYVWHTTGSGKTMTSFKSAQLIAHSKDADKVVFLIDRIELGTQSANEYRNFKDENEDIQETEDTTVLVSKLKSNSYQDTLIVTSIQKMSNIGDDYFRQMKQADIDAIMSKRIVFIVDECHRSTFGDMMQIVKHNFPTAIFFGFSGTPIQIENLKKGSTTTDVFGNELHRYSIADGIRDKNVLGFDPIKVLTFKDQDIRQVVAFHELKVQSEAELCEDESKQSEYYKFINDYPMAGHVNEDGSYEKGIEDYLIKCGQYRTEEHQNKVVEDIVDNWSTLSHQNKFHAIFATSSIPEAVQYYQRFKELAPQLNVTVLFDPSIDNKGNGPAKEKALEEIIADYNAKYKQSFSIPTYARMKKDIQFRLAHKKPYERIAKDHSEQIDLLIVVDQMLTGFDSKWLNVLYLDKLLRYENIIQAFSRTNRLFGPDKPFGTIKYYRAPYTMEQNIIDAVKVYSGDKPLGMFVDKLDENLASMNDVFARIKDLFIAANLPDFESLPAEIAEKKQFAELLKEFNTHLESAKVQGFSWDQMEYSFPDENVDYDETSPAPSITMACDENTYKVMVLRYKELFSEQEESIQKSGDCPYDLDGYITTIDTDKIDADYMNSRFDKFLKALSSGDENAAKAARAELHKTFATLTQEEQRHANHFLHDMDTGDVVVDAHKTLRDYINEYQQNDKDKSILHVVESFGVDETMLQELIAAHPTEANLNEYGRFDNLKATVDNSKARAYCKAVEGKDLPAFMAIVKVDKFLRDFVLHGTKLV